MNATELPAREAMEFDVVVVGAGPAGLAAAIRLKQLSPETSVVVVEKGSEVGAHILSGAVIDPIGLDELVPDWRSEQASDTHAGQVRPLLLCSAIRAVRLPNFLMPPLMSNHGNYIVSLGKVCRWLGTQGRSAGRGDLSGLSRRRGAVRRTERSRASSPATWAWARTVTHKAGYTRGMELRGKYTLFAEGARGSLSKQLIAKFSAA